MCNCASCEYTDRFSAPMFIEGYEGAKACVYPKNYGFDMWPRGNPAGKRASERDYAAHVSHAWSGVYKRVPFTPSQAPQFPAWMRGNGPIQPNTEAIRWNAGRKASPELPEPARPELPAKAAQHFPELDRQPEAKANATILAMPKAKPKRGRGRPQIPGRFVIVKLEERLIERAEKLGNGKITQGIRAALEKVKAA